MVTNVENEIIITVPPETDEISSGNVTIITITIAKIIESLP